MQRVFHPLRLVGVQFKHRGGLILLAAALVLTLLTPALASAQTAAPIRFNNQTNATLEIEAESIVDVFGAETPLRLNWSVKPGLYTYLVDANNNKIHATKFNCVLKANGKSIRWTWTSTGLDADGAFGMAFTQENLQKHLGGVVVRQAAFQPPPRNGPTDEQLKNAAGKIIIAVVAHAVAEKVLADNPNGIVEQIAAGLARGGRDAALQSALRDLFPGLTQGQSRDIQTLVSAAADGRLNIRNLTQQEAKQRLVNAVRSNNPDLADAAVVADFIYAVYQLSQNR